MDDVILASLWSLAPSPVGTPQPSRASPTVTRWETLTARGRHVRVGEESWAVDQTLVDMCSGTFDEQAFVAPLRASLLRGDLVVGRLITMLDLLFLRGGLQLAFRPALSLLETAVEVRAARIDVLLDMLTEYARPGAGTCGAHVVDLASRAVTPTGTSAAARAAAALRARLADASRPSGDDQLPVGLWSLALDPAPGDAPVRLSAPDDLTVLAARAGDDTDVRAWQLGTNAPEGMWVRPSALLADVVSAAGRLGVLRVREALRDPVRAPIEQAPATWAGPFSDRPGPVGAAVDLWASGALSLETYPRLWSAPCETTGGAEPYSDEALWEEPTKPYSRLRLDRSLLSPRPVLPVSLDPPAVRVLLLHACECLLLAPGRQVPLSTPTRLDGTVSLGDVLSRLDEGPVGPLDLLLALHRLRPWDDADAARLDTVDHARQTDASVSGRHPMPVGDTIRRWVEGGGLPAVASDRAVARDHTTWAHALPSGPVLWAETDIAPDDALRTTDRATGALLRIVPRCPDLGVGHVPHRWGHGGHEVAALLTLHGHGEPVADLLVCALFGPDGGRDDVVREAARRVSPERLDPAVLLAATRRRGELGMVTPGRATPVLRALFLHGGLPSWWPVALDLAADGCAARRLPPGLDGLLDLLTGMLVEVPDRRLPAAVHDLAVRPGRTKARDAALRLVREAQRLDR